MILWLKALHIIFMVCWFSGLFYLPRLFVYHALAKDDLSLNRFKIMERKLYFGITTPCGILTVLTGFSLLYYLWDIDKSQLWLHLKLGLVFLLIIYHIYLGKLFFDFKANRNQHTHVFYRLINEIPLVFLAAIVLLVILKPT